MTETHRPKKEEDIFRYLDPDVIQPSWDGKIAEARVFNAEFAASLRLKEQEEKAKEARLKNREVVADEERLLADSLDLTVEKIREVLANPEHFKKIYRRIMDFRVVHATPGFRSTEQTDEFINQREQSMLHAAGKLDRYGESKQVRKILPQQPKRQQKGKEKFEEPEWQKKIKKGYKKVEEAKFRDGVSDDDVENALNYPNRRYDDD